jgi:hypothetical protein
LVVPLLPVIPHACLEIKRLLGYHRAAVTLKVAGAAVMRKPAALWVAFEAFLFYSKSRFMVHLVFLSLSSPVREGFLFNPQIASNMTL